MCHRASVQNRKSYIIPTQLQLRGDIHKLRNAKLMKFATSLLSLLAGIGEILYKGKDQKARKHFFHTSKLVKMPVQFFKDS